MNVPRCKCGHSRLDHLINNGACEICKCTNFSEVLD